jgi:hypothetical protein
MMIVANIGEINSPFVVVDVVVAISVVVAGAL